MKLSNLKANHPEDAIYLVYLLALEEIEQKETWGAVISQTGIGSLYSFVEQCIDDLIFDLSFFGNDADKRGMLLAIGGCLAFMLKHPEDRSIWSYSDDYPYADVGNSLWYALRYVSRSLIAPADMPASSRIVERLTAYIVDVKNQTL